MGSGTQLAPPPFVRLAADPLRWRLLRELARSDRRVRELVTLAERPQNLVSYHLGRLRAAGLVVARRSSFDGRDTYYHLDLVRCAQSLAAAGAALHPSLHSTPLPRPRHDAAPPGSPAEAGSVSYTVLFVCTGNSARSQAAEAIVRARSGGRILAFSAGTQPKSLHPNAVRAMASRGIDLAGQRPKHISEFAKRHFTYVITLCDRAREVSPEFSGDPAQVHWSIPDPAASAGDHEDTYPDFELMAAELETRIGFWLAAVGAAPARTHIQEA
jgi:ArsR family transcriptional regulator, arsenate/arsenite/antimonite-responsive transcriptional repressor / arsenate reductase (thioredoxin)